jgi:hypothetical protein
MARRPVAGIVLAALLSLGGCSLFASPAPVGVPGPANPAVLSVENRGGPLLSVRVNGAEVLKLPCDDARTIEPGVNGVPRLPWIVTVARVDGNVVVATQPIADLPQWYVQIGDSSLGFGTRPVQGPPGPSCGPP